MPLNIKYWLHLEWYVKYLKAHSDMGFDKDI